MTNTDDTPNRGPFTDGDDPEQLHELDDQVVTNDAVAGETVLPSNDDDVASDGVEDARVPQSVNEDPTAADDDLPESLDERQRQGSLAEGAPVYAENDLADEEDEIDLRDRE